MFSCHVLQVMLERAHMPYAHLPLLGAPSLFSISSLELEKRGILPLRLTGGGVLDALSLPRLGVSGKMVDEEGWLRLADHSCE